VRERGDNSTSTFDITRFNQFQRQFDIQPQQSLTALHVTLPTYREWPQHMSVSRCLNKASSLKLLGRGRRLGTRHFSPQASFSICTIFAEQKN
jgi:hypothetical protein